MTTTARTWTFTRDQLAAACSRVRVLHAGGKVAGADLADAILGQLPAVDSAALPWEAAGLLTRLAGPLRETEAVQEAFGLSRRIRQHLATLGAHPLAPEGPQP